ncbi:MAG: LysM peptidoglycan-binding domain-containing protein [Solirubrobacteraceae bacterium]
MCITGLAAAAAVYALAAAPATAGTVRVRPGDTLSALAARYATTLHVLAAANGISDVNAIYAGERLKLPADVERGTSSSNPGAHAPARSAVGGGSPSVTVTVARGETLSAIAARYGITVAALVRANRITDPNQIVAGARLVVPGAKSVHRSAASSGSRAGSVTASPVSFVTGASRSLSAALLAHPDRLALLPYFESAAGAYGVPASLLEGLCWWESGWQEAVVSHTGAIGVCQIEPSTAAFVNTFLAPGHPLDSSTVAGNIDMGAAYLAYLLRQTGESDGLALGAYFQGLASVRQRGLLPGTRHYVAGILACDAAFAAG